MNLVHNIFTSVTSEMDRQSAPVVDGAECMEPLLACRVPDGKVDTFPTNVDLFVEKRSLKQQQQR